MNTPDKRLFPPYLNFGSSGAAVKFLQQLLNVASYIIGIDPPEVTGKYEEQTRDSIMDLQGKLGFTGNDVDGNFGPKTREAFLKTFNLAVDLAEAGSTDTTDWYSPEGFQGAWPRHELVAPTPT